MARTPRKKAQSGYYHVMMRGNGRMVIFTDTEDRYCFLTCLEEALEPAEIKLIAWCLMDNHCHLLLSDDYDNLSEAMHNIATRYALHFNNKTGHVGSVFQGRFASKPIESNDYLLRAVRYIHNNPCETGVAREQFFWSSYHEYVGSPNLIDSSIVLELIGGKDRFAEFSAEKTSSYRPFASRRIGGKELLREVSSTLDGIDPMQVKSLAPRKQESALRKLARAGFSERQMERATGIGRYRIARILASNLSDTSQ